VQADPTFAWSKPPGELVEFVCSFLATGAVGFRYSAVRGKLGGRSEARVHDDSARLAALIGLFAQFIIVGRLGLILPQLAERQQTTVGGLLTGWPSAVGPWLAFLALIGFALAAARLPIGWPLAALGAIVGPLAAIFTGQWARLVNPLHMLFGGLWIGTLFILVVAGLSMVLRDEPSREERGRLAAEMVNAFSPLALTCGVLLVASGLTTAWMHLGSIPALWSTPYGYALLVKLALVATVFTLGAWNWRRQRPELGSEGAAHSIRRSARAELLVAGLVLIVTSILVTFPAPAEQRPPVAPPAATQGP
jgi:putative copper export protein